MGIHKTRYCSEKKFNYSWGGGYHKARALKVYSVQLLTPATPTKLLFTLKGKQCLIPTEERQHFQTRKCLSQSLRKRRKGKTVRSFLQQKITQACKHIWTQNKKAKIKVLDEDEKKQSCGEGKGPHANLEGACIVNLHMLSSYI